MGKTTAFLKKEILEMIPPTLFFLAVFLVVVFARSLMGDAQSGVELVSVSAAVIGALIVGKSILIADALPLFHWLDNRPAIYNTLWRIFLYMSIIFMFQVLEELIPLSRKFGGVGEGFSHLMQEVHWSRFWATHLIFSMFMVLYCLLSTLVGLLGVSRVYQEFFGSTAASPDEA